jgi:hypothetical protein
MDIVLDEAARESQESAELPPFGQYPSYHKRKPSSLLAPLASS